MQSVYYRRHISGSSSVTASGKSDPSSVSPFRPLLAFFCLVGFFLYPRPRRNGVNRENGTPARKCGERATSCIFCLCSIISLQCFGRIVFTSRVCAIIVVTQRLADEPATQYEGGRVQERGMRQRPPGISGRLKSL